MNERNLINKFIDIMKISNKMNNNTLNDNNNIFEQIDEIELLGKERPENIFEQKDEIEILGKEQPENIFEQIDEIEILGKEQPENIFEHNR